MLSLTFASVDRFFFSRVSRVSGAARVSVRARLRRRLGISRFFVFGRDSFRCFIQTSGKRGGSTLHTTMAMRWRHPRSGVPLSFPVINPCFFPLSTFLFAAAVINFFVGNLYTRKTPFARFDLCRQWVFYLPLLLFVFLLPPLTVPPSPPPPSQQQQRRRSAMTSPLQRSRLDVFFLFC